MKKQILTMGLAVVASVASAASPAFTTAAERVDSLMRCLFHDGEPGAAVVVAKNDDVIVDSGYGVADIVTGDRIDGNTMFNIASISKQFTVAGVLSLADRGLLRADNAVADFLPYESGQWRKIRLSHLMSHSSSDDVYYNAASYDFSVMRFRLRGYAQEYSQMYVTSLP